MIDFETVFPSISRPQLYHQLRSNGIQGNILRIIESLTKEHSVRVLHSDIDDNDYVKIERGLAEGSVLSPRLYHHIPSCPEKDEGQIPREHMQRQRRKPNGWVQLRTPTI
jgi:hypothetical protein